MYTSNNNVETIDGDAQDMMAQVYGSYDAGCTDSYCGGHAAINLPSSPVVVHPLTAAQLQAVLQRKAQDAESAANAERADVQNMKSALIYQVYPQPFAPTTPAPLP